MASVTPSPGGVKDAPVESRDHVISNKLKSLEESLFFKLISLTVQTVSFINVLIVLVNAWVLLTLAYFCFTRVAYDKLQTGSKSNTSFFYCVTAIPPGTLFFFYLHLERAKQRLVKLQETSPTLIIADNEFIQYDWQTKITFLVVVTSSLSMTFISKYRPNIGVEEWALIIIYLIIFVFLWKLVHSAVLRCCKEMYQFRGPAFKDFVDQVRPLFILSASLEFFFIMAMISEKMAAEYSTTSIPQNWSAGYSALACNFTLTATCIAWVYAFGAGLVQNADFQENVVSASTSEYESRRKILITFFNYLIVIDVIGFLLAASLTWTTYDATRFFYVTCVGLVLWVLVGYIILMLRTLGPKTVRSLLWMYEKKYHFFISHAQATGGDQVHSMTKELQRRDCAVWWDMELESEITEEAMKKGIEDSLVVIVFLTKDSMKRYFTKLEVNYAIQLNKSLIVIAELDPRHNGFESMQQCISDIDEEFKKALFDNYEVISYSRRAYLSDAMYSEILKRLMTLSR